MIPYYLYILYSPKVDQYYIGISHDPENLQLNDSLRSAEESRMVCLWNDFINQNIIKFLRLVIFRLMP